MGNLLEVFWRFLCLGCVSFGGPAAHIGYFHTSFVQKYKWIDEHSYARLVALSQFLPGPGSSQIGFALGVRQAGLLGGCAAFIGFTLPSFILLYLVATLQTDLSSYLLNSVIDGLKLLAVVVVADACYKMYSTFCTNKLLIGLAITASAITLTIPSLWSQIAVLIFGATVTILYKPKDLPRKISKTKSNKRPNQIAFIVFAILFFVPALLSSNSIFIKIFADFYQAGSLVFGGGHVVLPLLDQTIGNNLTSTQFLTGYASAQAVPGPMFSLAAYLGAILSPTSSLHGALIATIAIFLPGFLLILWLQDAWESLVNKPNVAACAAGINATVVGLLVAALYQPVFTNAINSLIDVGLVIVGLFLLNVIRLPILTLVFGYIAIGILKTLVFSGSI